MQRRLHTDTSGRQIEWRRKKNLPSYKLPKLLWEFLLECKSHASTGMERRRINMAFLPFRYALMKGHRFPMSKEEHEKHMKIIVPQIGACKETIRFARYAVNKLLTIYPDFFIRAENYVLNSLSDHVFTDSSFHCATKDIYEKDVYSYIILTIMYEYGIDLKDIMVVQASGISLSGIYGHVQIIFNKNLKCRINKHHHLNFPLKHIYMNDIYYMLPNDLPFYEAGRRIFNNYTDIYHKIKYTNRAKLLAGSDIDLYELNLDSGVTYNAIIYKYMYYGRFKRITSK